MCRRRRRQRVQDKEGAAKVLREWAAEHPSEAHDAHFAAKAEQKERKAEEQAARAAGPKAVAMYEALGAEDQAKADSLKKMKF